MLTTPVVERLAFPECLRWHDGALWFSDIVTGSVHRLRDDGSLLTAIDGIDRVAGLGWLPDGDLLLVAGSARRLLRIGAAGRSTHADLSALADHACNDMTVDALGRAWVGHWGFDYAGGAAPRPATLLRVDADGSVHVGASELMFPNGIAITPGGGTLIVAESYAQRLTAFTIAPSGALIDRRVWAVLQPATADGICLDADGALWVASPTTGEVLRVLEGGGIAERIAMPEAPLSVMLGGDDRRTLFIASAPLFMRKPGGRRNYTSRDQLLAERRGCIDSIRVGVPGAGSP